MTTKQDRAVRAPSRRRAAYDGFRVIKGVVVGCALSVPLWVGIGIAVKALVG